MRSLEISIDDTDFQNMMHDLRSVMKPQQFENAMAGIFKRTGSKVKTILGNDLPKQYIIPRAEVRKSVGGAKTVSSGLGVGCTIPIRAERRKMAHRASARTYGANGGAKGWDALKYAGRPYKVKPKILRSGGSVLPVRMSSYGGQPPFVNTAAPSLNNIVFTRAGKSRFPIEKVMGVAIPQMPLNRSEHDVQEDIADYLMERMAARLNVATMMGR